MLTDLMCRLIVAISVPAFVHRSLAVKPLIAYHLFLFFFILESFECRYIINDRFESFI